MVIDRVVHGDDLPYRFFRDLFKTEPELLGVVPQLLVETMAISLRIPAPSLHRERPCDGVRYETSEMRKYPYAYQTRDKRWLIERALV
jgi:hypothetical protein